MDVCDMRFMFVINLTYFFQPYTLVEINIKQIEDGNREETFFILCSCANETYLSRCNAPI